MESIQFLFFLVAYLIGSIPSGLIIGKKFRNIDIRNHGSKNIGTTNAFRILGAKLGIIVFIMDVLKGGIPILIGRIMFHNELIDNNFYYFIMLYGVAAAIGHMFPIFAKFKGGKAVATGFGILLFYSPLIAVIGILSFIITVKISKYISLGSMIGALSSTASTYVIYFSFPAVRDKSLIWVDIPLLTLITLLCLIVIIRHKSNIKRLINGTENKIGQKKKQE